MIQPVTWTAISTASKSIWTVVSPLVYISAGALLTRSWDRKKSLNDNRKEECRELLNAVIKVADGALEARAQIESSRLDRTAVTALWAEERKCMIVLEDRIFIAADLKKKKVRSLWTKTTTEFMTDGDRKKFGDRLDEVKKTLIDIALNR